MTLLYSYFESFEEFRIDIAKQHGRVRRHRTSDVVSKAGTDELHATGPDYYATPMFRARDPFALGLVSHGTVFGGEHWPSVGYSDRCCTACPPAIRSHS